MLLIDNLNYIKYSICIKNFFL